MNLDDLTVLLRNLAPTIPLDKAIWAPEDVANYLRVAPRTVTDKYSVRPDFPKTIRLPSQGRNGAKRWKAAEIIEWAEKRRG